MTNANYPWTNQFTAVLNKDGMKGQWYRIPLEVLKKVSARITDEVKEVNRVVYDITSKAPATIE